MVTFALSALLGVLGSAIKPIAFVAAAVVLCALTAAATAEAAWLPVLTTFYACLAIAEISYVGVLAIRG